jgi:bacillithiol biosynthesis deacetylase BshB1
MARACLIWAGGTKVRGMEPAFEAVLDTFDPAARCEVLCFGAHPDDVEMAMGGTVAALVATGSSVGIIDLTRGEMGTYGDANTRLEEARDAARALGVARRVYAHPDGGLQDNLETRHQIVGILREYRPSLVFAPWPWARTGALDGRANVDHLACGLSVREATKLSRMRKLLPELPAHGVRRLFYYMVPDAEKPGYCVDVSAHRAAIVSSIEAHASQMAIKRGERGVLELLMMVRAQVGLRLGVELAEAFISEDPLFGPASILKEI